jgi:hypothetical protein
MSPPEEVYDVFNRMPKNEGFEWLISGEKKSSG